MPEDIEDVEKPQRSQEQLKDDLVVAQRRLDQLVSAKKAIVRQYNEDIQNAQEEIVGIMQQLN